MKLFKNSNGELFGFELDGSQDHLIGDLIPVTPEEAKETIRQNLFLTWDDIKATRDALLKACDWSDLPNSPVKNRPAWLRYRQELRDLPQNFKTPQDVIWPNKPA